MRILLAPMEGLLDYMLRDTLTRFGCHPGETAIGENASGDNFAGINFGAGIDACVTEFIRITNSLLPAHSFYRVVPELKNQCRTPAGVPVRVQILGSDPICMAENAAKVAGLGALGIDINFGCPANTVNRHRGGAALLKEPELMRTIVRAVRGAVPASIPVTAKMRLGYDSPESALDCAQALNDGGAAEIVVHARTKTDGYKPPAYWEWIAKIREHIPIPVIANGEIWNADDAMRCRAVSGCEDIMIGRGAVANPALALMIRGRYTAELPWFEIESLLYQFWLTIEMQVPERHRHGRMKQWLHYLSRNYPQAQIAFNAIRSVVDPEKIRQVLFSELNEVQWRP